MLANHGQWEEGKIAMTELKHLSPAEVSKILGVATSTSCRMRQTGLNRLNQWGHAGGARSEEEGQ